MNSYGKETRAKLWNSEELKWITQEPLPRLLSSEQLPRLLSSEQLPRRSATPLQFEGELESSGINSPSVEGVPEGRGSGS